MDYAQWVELERLVEDTKQARPRLIECNLRLVVSVVRRYLGHRLSFLDVVQEGNIGLQIGVEQYDWRRAVRFLIRMSSTSPAHLPEYFTHWRSPR